VANYYFVFSNFRLSAKASAAAGAFVIIFLPFTVHRLPFVLSLLEILLVPP
jgi:hypothetical protein